MITGVPFCDFPSVSDASSVAVRSPTLMYPLWSAGRLCRHGGYLTLMMLHKTYCSENIFQALVMRRFNANTLPVVDNVIDFHIPRLVVVNGSK